TWNGGERFQTLLDALARQTVEHELVCVDSGSSDGTAERVVAAGGRLHEIPQSEFNHGATRNLGISLAAGEVIALLTQDAVPMDDTYLEAIRDAYRDERVDAAYARQFPLPEQDPILKERLRRWSASRDEDVLQVLVHGDPEASKRLFDELEPLERLGRCAFDNVASSIRRSTWERMPFPHASFGEDVSLGHQLLLSGGAIAFVAAARVEHSHPISIKREFKRLYCDHHNLYRLFGVRLVPSWKHVREGWKFQSRFYADLVASQEELSEAERKRWTRYGYWYALAETSSQFLGVRSHWKVHESRFWAWFDKRVRRGV
ncbi:MAG: glycosyltransferase family 2 protein, partial [Planctomycetota bacterium]